MNNVLASIPSPSSGSLDIGPLSLNAYGLMIALGVVAAVWQFGRRVEQKGFGTREDASAISIWAVPAGVIGSRLYHVATDWDRFEDNLGDIPKIWQGGLGVPGGIAAGIGVGLWMVHRRGLPLGQTANAAAPSVPLAQAIGRVGNWFNQELFGGPTDLPWALRIDDDKLIAEGLAPDTTVHPTFLYESLWNLALCALLLWIDRRWRPAGGRLLGMYVVGYGVGRFWVEGLRIDDADELGPFRWNQWVALAAIVGGLAYLVATRNKVDPVPVPDADVIDDDDDVEPGAVAIDDEAEDDEDEREIAEAERENAAIADDDVEDADAHESDDDDAEDAEDAEVRSGRRSTSRTGAAVPDGEPGSADPPSAPS